MTKVVAIVSWVIVAWISYVFLGSLPYKFTLHPDTQHIFGTIGDWLSGFLGSAIGSLFANFGSYVVGSFELITVLVLLMPALIWLKQQAQSKNQASAKTRAENAPIEHSTAGTRHGWHQAGGLMASAVMAGAVFFHLFTPLGIEVLHNGASDNGSLFYSAVSILVLGVVLFLINRLTNRKSAH